jgi:ATP-dependent DNA helicase RecG
MREDKWMVEKMKEAVYKGKFEELRSENQALTFIQAEAIFKKSQIELDLERQKSMGLMNADSEFTNLALLLSDQNSFTTTVAMIQDGDQLICKLRESFTGSLLKQLHESFAYLEKLNRTRAEIKGLLRRDYRDYPVEAIREALINAVAHRDYHSSRPTTIKLFEDRLEFVSVGGLTDGYVYADLMLGLSAPRNEKLMEVLQALRFVENVGVGHLNIYKCYVGEPVQPKIEVSEHVFKLTLPNQNSSRERGSIEASGNVREAESLYGVEQSIVELIGSRYSVSRKEIETAFGLSQSRAVRLLNHLIEKGWIICRGSGKNTVYVSNRFAAK